MAQQLPTHRLKSSTQKGPQASHFDTAVSVNVPQKPLPPVIAILIDKAAAYSSDDLRRLSYLLRDSDHGPRLAGHPRIIKLFLGYLKERELFMTNQGRVFPELGLCGIRAVIQILEAAETIDDNNTFLVQSLTQSWPDIWFWMNYKTDPETSAAPERLQLAVDIINGICTNFPKSSADRAIASTPGVCSMVADVWARQCDQVSTDGVVFASSELLLHLVSSEAVSVKDMYGTPAARRRTSSTLLKIIQAFSRDDIDLIEVLPTPLLLAERLARESTELDAILLSQNLIGIVCRVLTFRSSCSPPSSPLAVRGLSLCLFGCMHYLVSAMLQHGYTCIVPAVRAGLIPSLLRCARLDLKFDELDKYIVVTIHLLARHTIYPSLLRALRVAWEDPVVILLEGQVPRNTLWDNWTGFKDVLEVRIAFKANFSKQKKSYLMCRCEKCPNKAPPSSYRLCSGCLDVFYCSKICQKYDWKQGGHRGPCKTALEGRVEGTRINMTVRDQYFALSLALVELTVYAKIRDIDRKDPLISKIAKSSAKDPERIITIDLSSNPTTFQTDVRPDIASPLDKSTDQSERYYMTEPDPDSPSTRLKIFLIAPYGGERYTLVFVEYISNDLAGLIFARDAPKRNA